MTAAEEEGDFASARMEDVFPTVMALPPFPANQQKCSFLLKAPWTWQLSVWGIFFCA